MEENEHALFNGAQDVLLTGLQRVSDKVGRHLEDQLKEMAEQVK